MTRSRVLLSALVVLVVAGVALAWYLLRPAPDEVDLDAAVGQIADGDADADTADRGEVDDGAPDADPLAEGADGTWTVSTTASEFSVEDTTGTFVGFRVREELADVGITDAVGRTPDVTGTFEVDGTTVTAASFEADLTTIVSDRSMRDGRIQSALDTATHPTATFTLTDPIELDAVPADGEAVAVDAVGELTVHGVTETVTVPLEAALTGDVLVVTSSFEVELATYGVEVPSAPIVVSAEDVATVEIQLFLTR
ncbi:YceI family protein [Nitriliruptoraceae bacterium ZYF776]|nr:YceI family protein [Profundirhabdus halotolerans]